MEPIFSSGQILGSPNVFPLEKNKKLEVDDRITVKDLADYQQVILHIFKSTRFFFKLAK